MNKHTLFSMMTIIFLSSVVFAQTVEEYNPTILPNSFFYPAKLAGEKMRLFFVFDKNEVFKLKIQFAQRRIKEISLLEKSDRLNNAFLADQRLGELLRDIKESDVDDDHKKLAADVTKRSEEVLVKTIERFKTDDNVYNDNAIVALQNALSRINNTKKALLKDEGKTSR